MAQQQGSRPAPPGHAPACRYNHDDFTNVVLALNFVTFFLLLSANYIYYQCVMWSRPAPLWPRRGRRKPVDGGGCRGEEWRRGLMHAAYSGEEHATLPGWLERMVV